MCIRDSPRSQFFHDDDALLIHSSDEVAGFAAKQVLDVLQRTLVSVRAGFQYEYHPPHVHFDVQLLGPVIDINQQQICLLYTSRCV